MDGAELETTTKKKGIRPYQNCLVVFCIECVERLLAALSENNDQNGNRRSNNLRSEKEKTLYLEHINSIFTLPLPTSHHQKNIQNKETLQKGKKNKKKSKSCVLHAHFCTAKRSGELVSISNISSFFQYSSDTITQYKVLSPMVCKKKAPL